MGTIKKSTVFNKQPIFFILVCIAVLIGGFMFYLDSRNGTEPYVADAFRLTETLPYLEYAITDVDRIRGLSGREALSSDAGLFFVFEEPSLYGIWMKEMQFAIDIIWLDEAGKIVGLAENIQPDSYPTVFYPDAPAQFVLEANAGFAQTHALRVGTHIMLPENRFVF